MEIHLRSCLADVEFQFHDDSKAGGCSLACACSRELQNDVRSEEIAHIKQKMGLLKACVAAKKVVRCQS